jgi:hypothetical protein
MALFKEWNKPPKCKDIVEYIKKNNLEEYDFKVQDNDFLLMHKVTDVEVSHSSQSVVFFVSEE